jgi:hypothetical protein
VIRFIQSNGGVVVASPVAQVIIVTGDKRWAEGPLNISISIVIVAIIIFMGLIVMQLYCHRTLQLKSMIDAGKNDVVHFR